MTTEEWRPIPGYDGIYEVSDIGRVRRAKATWNGTKVGHIHKPRESHSGYVVVTLSKDSVARGRFVHRLVTAAFIGPLPEGLQVNHKDGNKLNNRPDNLEYVTCSQNALHARRVLRRGPDKRGTKHHFAKLTEQKVLEMRAAYAIAPPRSIARLARQFGCANSVANRIVHRKIWRHI